MAAPLALDVAPHGELPGWRKGEEALDSLGLHRQFYGPREGVGGTTHHR